MSSTAAPVRSATPAGGAPLPRGTAALFGVLAVAAALGAGHLVAGIVSPASSPYLAVGDAVVRASPQPLVEFAKQAFGTADKPVLLAGMGVVLLAVAALAGLASRRRPGPGVAVVAVLGVLGLLAVVLAPVFAPLDLLAPLASMAAGIGVLRALHALARGAAPTRAGGADGAADGTGDAAVDGTVRGDPGGVSRRTVLAGASAAVGLGSLAAAGVGQVLGSGAGDSRARVTARLATARLAERAPAIPPGAAFPELGTPTFLTPNADFYRIDTALRIPNLTAEDWSLRVHGLVDRELVLTFDDLLARPLVERTITMTCVSNPLGGDLVSTADFIGVELRPLLEEAGVRPGADQLFTRSADGWYTGTPTSVVMEPDRGALLAVGMNGEALPPEHGFPVRMVVPGLYGYVSACKWIVDAELTTFADRVGYWSEAGRGWAVRAPIKTMSRIDRPRGFASVPAGPVVVAGTAWAQGTGIARVEVRVDGGPWRDAELATAVNDDTWRMWRTTVDLAPGSHTVQARATDESGATQTEVRADPVPDGASGWPATIITVT